MSKAMFEPQPSISQIYKMIFRLGSIPSHTFFLSVFVYLLWDFFFFFPLELSETHSDYLPLSPGAGIRGVCHAWLPLHIWFSPLAEAGCFQRWYWTDLILSKFQSYHLETGNNNSCISVFWDGKLTPLVLWRSRWLIRRAFVCIQMAR